MECAIWELVAEEDSLETVRKLVHRLGSENARLVVIKEKEPEYHARRGRGRSSTRGLIRDWPRLRSWLDEDRAD